MEIEELEKQNWWTYLEYDLQELFRASLILVNNVPKWKDKFHDYSFIVFPASKAYEGFLKKLFFDLGFIKKEDYFGKRFRIGKALNPSLDREKYKGQSVYDKIIEHCGGKELAETLWNAWKNCRNLIFHWFPNEARAITYDEAKQRLSIIFDSIDAAFRDCKVSK